MKYDIMDDLEKLISFADHIVQGDMGMWQYHFQIKTIALEFLQQLQSRPDLISLGIDKAAVKEEKCKKSDEKCFIVRLTEKQKLSLTVNEEKAAEFLLPNHVTSLTGGFAFHFRDENEAKKALDMIQQQVGRTPKLREETCTHDENSENAENAICFTIRFTPEEVNKIYHSVNASRLFEILDEKNSCFAISLFQRSSNPILNTALVLEGRPGWCGLVYLMIQIEWNNNRDSTAFQNILQKAHQKAIDQALIKKNKHRASTLTMAALWLNSTLFQA